MMNELINKLHEGNFSCVIAHGNTVRTFSGRGVSDLHHFLKTEPAFLKNASVADKVVGKAAAALMIKGGVINVYSDLISEPALFLLRQSNIKVQYKQLVSHIENRDKTDWCPLEKSCYSLTSTREILTVIDKFISKIINKSTSAIILLFSFLFVSASAQTTTKDTLQDKIRIAVERQINTYPQSTLQDLYKSFFQDYFGAGHIMGDTLSAGVYLDNELASFKHTSGLYYEPTGYNGNFYRVNLSVVKENLIPRNVFFKAFVRSVIDIPISIEEWKKKWILIDSVIYAMHLPLENHMQDRTKIFSLLEQGKYVGHHSELFSKAYDPHYRIIKRDIFFKEILPYLPKNN